MALRRIPGKGIFFTGDDSYVIALKGLLGQDVELETLVL
jgi:hypothetical protein